MAKRTIGKEDYIIGIDSGATSSQALLVSLSNGEQRGIYKKYLPVNFNVLGFDESVKRLTHIIKDSSRKTGLKSIAQVVAGVAGARNEEDRKKLAGAVMRNAGLKRIKILPDAEIAFYSVFTHNQTNCGILIAGTGSVLYYKDTAGALMRAGGWGRILGDEGSGWWIAREALAAAVKNFDRAMKPLRISVMLKKKFGLQQGNIIKEIYHENFEISQITKEVFRLAENYDRFSIRILKQAAEHLAELLTPLTRSEFIIALSGSLFTEEKLLERYLVNIAEKKYPNISFVKPDRKPVWGAIEIGRRLVHSARR